MPTTQLGPTEANAKENEEGDGDEEEEEVPVIPDPWKSKKVA